MFTNNFDPVAFEFFSISIRWYSLAYIFGIIFGWIYCKKILIKTATIQKLFDDYISYLIIGIIIGGRLGYVFFYNFSYFLKNPIEVFMLWNGGMSFHGGLIGIIVFTYLFSKKNNQNIFIFLDLVSIVAPIGIFLGRISNFINGELYGRPSSILFGIIFPTADDQYRHPSQLYEAFLEGLLLFIILNISIFFFKTLSRPGYISGLFLLFYGLFRFLVEFSREPDIQVGYVYDFLTMGMILSVPMVIAGIGILIVSSKR